MPGSFCLAQCKTCCQREWCHLLYVAAADALIRNLSTLFYCIYIHRSMVVVVARHEQFFYCLSVNYCFCLW